MYTSSLDQTVCYWKHTNSFTDGYQPDYSKCRALTGQDWYFRGSGKEEMSGRGWYFSRSRKRKFRGGTGSLGGAAKETCRGGAGILGGA